MTVRPGLILFAHGARDPRWAEPFEAIRQAIESRRGDVIVRLAYLELMRPTLDEAVADLTAQNCSAIRIAPIFFGQGGHVREDLPTLVAAIRVRYPAVAFVCLDAAGEDTAVRKAVAQYCLDGI
jgi:sirohydrochlorin cobaltochelatase